jgi:hypothetical protein
MASGKLVVLTAQVNVQGPPRTGSGLPKLFSLFQSPNGINDDDSSSGSADRDLLHRVDDPAGSLKCGTEPTSLKLATAKIATSAGCHKAGSADVLSGSLPRKVAGERRLT